MKILLWKSPYFGLSPFILVTMVLVSSILVGLFEPQPIIATQIGSFTDNLSVSDITTDYSSSESAKLSGFEYSGYYHFVTEILDPIPDTPWNTFLSGSSDSDGRSIAVDSSGNVYVTGRSSDLTWGSPVRPYTSGSDAWVAKLDNSGELQWNTFLGGSGNDCGLGIAVDSSGNAYITGYSYASWQGTTDPIRSYTYSPDSFVAKLNSSGELQWNTFLGGSGYDSGYGIAVDDSGNIYVCGTSDANWGGGVRAYTSGTDAFTAKLNNNGTLQWMTFLGGSGTDYGQGIAVDSGGDAYVTGYSDATWGSPVRLHTNSNDAYIAKLGSNGELQWNTFLGGTSNDEGQSIAVDCNGDIFVSGRCYGSWKDTNPVRAFSFGIDAWAAKVDTSGSLIWNTFLGSSENDTGFGIAVDSSGNAYASGYSSVSWGSPILAYTAIHDAWAVKLSSSGELLWNSFLGGSGYDIGYGIAVDSSGNAYTTGRSDATWGSPIRSYTSGNDAWVAKLDANGELNNDPKPGDANCDGIINSLDITKVERILVGLDIFFPSADANQDGNINALDITKTERLVADLD